MSWSSFASKVLPTASFEETELTVRTVNVVPAGIVAANENCAAASELEIAISKRNVFMVVLWMRWSNASVGRRQRTKEFGSLPVR